MNRLHKKCVIASASFHLLLILILIVGPAFLSSNSRPDALPLLDFVPVKTVDALVSGGGNPKAQPPPAVVQPLPQPPAAVPPAPQPQPEPQKTIELVPDKVEPAKERKHTVEVSTKLVKRAPSELSDAKAAVEKRAREDAQRQAARAIGQAAAGIQSGLSGSTTIELKGPGGGGVPYANWLQAVNTVYQQAWDVPAGLTEDTPAVSASITIARDGSVISSKIIRFSGNSAADQSVDAVLNRVRHVAPLPEDSTDDQRTVTIHFINDRARI